MNKILLAILILAASVAAQTNTVYDRFRDVTVVTSQDRTIGDRRHFLTRCVYKGSTLTADSLRAFAIQFVAYSRDWYFIRYNDLRVIADNDRIEIGKATTNGEVVSAAGYVSVKESLSWSIKPADMEKMAKATKLDMQIGGLEFTLKEKPHFDLKSVFVACSPK
jgi:hypothetical protein